MSTTTADVLVIGGGPAGAAAASRLAANGLRVILCERQAKTQSVCGEFVSAAAAAELAEIGIEPMRLDAKAITRTRIFAGGSGVTARLPSGGYGLSRARLDRALLETAAKRGAEVRTRSGVRTIARMHHIWSAATSNGDTIESGAIVLATGKHDLRGHPRAAGVPPMIGFKMHLRLDGEQAAALGDAVELFLYDGGYAGLQLMETGTANLCLVVTAADVRGRSDAWGTTLARLRRLAPALDARLRGCASLWARPLCVARIPYGYLCPTDGSLHGLYRVGDQAAVIPSFAGEGIAIALRSARLAADAVLAGDSAAHHACAVHGEVRSVVRRARMIEAVTRHRPLRRLVLGLGAMPGAVPLLARLACLRPADRRAA